MKTRFGRNCTEHAVTRIKGGLDGTGNSRRNNGVCGGINNQAPGVNVPSCLRE